MARTKTKRRTAAQVAAPTAPRFELPAIPSLEGDGATSPDAAIDALEQSRILVDAGDAASEPAGSPSSTTAAEPANTPKPASAELPAPARDRSPAAPVKDESSKSSSAKKADKVKPIALEAKEYRGMAVSAIREMLVVERRRNAELLERLERESPIAQAAIDEDLKDGIAETFGLLSEGVAFVMDEPEARFPRPTLERLGRVWAPIAKKYLGEYSEHIPIAAAAVATISAVIDRAAAVKEARAARAELAKVRKENGELETRAPVAKVA